MDFYGVIAEIKDDIQVQHRNCPFMKNIDVYDKEQKNSLYFTSFCLGNDNNVVQKSSNSENKRCYRVFSKKYEFVIRKLYKNEL